MRIDPLDDLAVELHHQAQHAVRGRMLRAEIDRVVLDRRTSPVRRARLDVGSSPQHLVRDESAHWFCPSPLVGTTSRLARACARLRRRTAASPAPVCAVLLGGLGRRRAAPWSRLRGVGLADLVGLQRRRRALAPRAARLLVARQDIFRAFPRAHEIERAEILRQLHRLVDDALLPLRNSAARHSRSAGSPCAADGRGSHSRSGCGAGRDCPRTARRTCRTLRARASRRPARCPVTDGTGLILVGLRHGRGCGGSRQREQAIDHFEPLGALRIVDARRSPSAADIRGPAYRAAAIIVSTRLSRVDGERRLRRRASSARQHVAPSAFSAASITPSFGRIGGCRRPHRSIVPTRRIFRCSCMMP